MAITVNRRKRLQILRREISKRPFSENKYVTVRTRYRDRTNINRIKRFYNNRCQYCGYRRRKENGNYICEAAHIVPHNETGDNRLENIFVLCPTHHREFDYGSLRRRNKIYRRVSRKYSYIRYNRLIDW